MKEHQDRYVVVAENDTLDDASTITLMKHNHICVIVVKVTHGWRDHGFYNIVLLRLPDRAIYKCMGEWMGAKDQGPSRLQTSLGRRFS